ncbi:MAG TPA: SHOCT domain-containing protein [Methylomirabilota bacterium]|jgi:putative membrane protein|nr:SHOCT domain-containing protein [Methylomirabilota bacterium]
MKPRLAPLLLLLLTPAVAAAQEGAYGWRGEWHPMWWMVGAWALGFGLLVLLFWVLVVVGFVVGLRWLVGQGRRSDAALAILRERYARGEINKEEFDAKRRDLS